MSKINATVDSYILNVLVLGWISAVAQPHSLCILLNNAGREPPMGVTQPKMDLFHDGLQCSSLTGAQVISHSPFVIRDAAALAMLGVIDEKLC